ncbi:MAG TPA: AI-2E family transporter [Bdellovibrionota bacterium]|nr:AI-2E family transporter [Bdellovibrionota bacterium]
MRVQNTERIFFGVLFILVLYFTYQTMRPFLPGIIWAAMLVVVFSSSYERVRRAFGGRRLLSAILMSTVITAFIVTPIVFALIKVSQGVFLFYQWVEAKIASGAFDPGLLLNRFPNLASVFSWLGRTDPQDLNLQEWSGSVAKAVGKLLSGTTNVLAGLVGNVFTLVVFYFTAIVLFHHSHKIVLSIRRFLPIDEEEKDRTFRAVRDVTRAVFYGILVTALVQGLLATIGFAVVGLSRAVMLGAMTFMVSLIPGGTMLVWGPAVVYLFATGAAWWKPILLLIWSVGVVSTADNFIRPIFISRSVELPVILVFFGVLGGLLAFGLIGLFLGPVVLTVFLLLLDVIGRDLARSEKASP